jgi:hypothetical protein
VARGGGARRVSGLSLMAVLCASAVAPVVLVGQDHGPVLADAQAQALEIYQRLGMRADIERVQARLAEFETE